MTRPAQLTKRNLLIAVHDAFATVGAIVLSGYLRFVGTAPSGEKPLLSLIILSMVALSVVACYVFGLTTSKWRFVSILDVFNILRVATTLSLLLVVIDYILLAPKYWRCIFFRKESHSVLLVL